MTVPCHICGGELHAVAGYDSFHRVTSDSRLFRDCGALAVCNRCGIVQKPADEKFRDEIDEIYRTYEIYHQSQGQEQAVFVQGAGEPRSMSLLRLAIAHLALGPDGRMLDVGCGNGGLLRSFAQLRPGWRLAGTEYSAVHKAQVEAIPGVEKLYVNGVDNPSGQFDLVTMLHSLEHFIHPRDFLQSLTPLFGSASHLLVEVPNFRENPFDLLIADHVTHFSPDALGRTLSAIGYPASTLTDQWIAKEISALARPGQPSDMARGGSDDGDAAARAVTLLQQVRDEALALFRRGADVGLFGSSIAATWLAGEMQARGVRVGFFVDEDQSRVGRQHLNIPIIAPAQLPTAAKVLVPLAPVVAGKLVARLGSQYRMPAALAVAQAH